MVVFGVVVSGWVGATIDVYVVEVVAYVNVCVFVSVRACGVFYIVRWGLFRLPQQRNYM